MAVSYTLQELASLVDGELSGNPDLQIRGLNGLEYAAADEITFITSEKKADELTGCKAGAVIVPRMEIDIDMPCIKVENPDLAAAVIHNHFLRKDFQAKGILQPTCMGENCHIPEKVTIGPMVSIGDRVAIGENVTIHPGVIIGSDCVIGDDTVVHANVSIADRSIIGDRVILHAGVSIGSDGFGYATDKQGQHHKRPQVGNVRIDDDVEIGANSCVDRAAFGTTRIRSGVKIDNQVMVAHNVDIGENSILVAQTGIAGSTTLGKNVVLAAKAGVAGHITLGDRCLVAAMSGVHNNLKDDSVVGGHIAFDIKKWRRANASFARLPEMIKELRVLRKQVDQLLKELGRGEDRSDKKRETE